MSSHKPKQVSNYAGYILIPFTAFSLFVLTGGDEIHREHQWIYICYIFLLPITLILLSASCFLVSSLSLRIETIEKKLRILEIVIRDNLSQNAPNKNLNPISESSNELSEKG
jgi:hypothetical protein